MESIIRLPFDFTEYNEQLPIYSEHDYQINETTAEAIKGRKYFNGCYAWNFYGVVWYDNFLHHWCVEIWEDNL